MKETYTIAPSIRRKECPSQAVPVCRPRLKQWQILCQSVELTYQTTPQPLPRVFELPIPGVMFATIVPIVPLDNVAAFLADDVVVKQLSR